MSIFISAKVRMIFEDVVNSIDFPNVAVCPLHIELFGLKQCDHVLLLCFDWKRGVDSGAACVDVLAFEVWVSACLEHYLPECFLISHNGDQYIRIFLKVNKFFQLFLFALPAHEVVESVIPLIMLFFRQANCLAASSADLFVTLLHLIRVVHVFHNFFYVVRAFPRLLRTV